MKIPYKRVPGGDCCGCKYGPPPSRYVVCKLVKVIHFVDDQHFCSEPRIICPDCYRSYPSAPVDREPREIALRPICYTEDPWAPG